jgi:PAS domain-containing protein
MATKTKQLPPMNTANDCSGKADYLQAIFDSMAHMVALVNTDMQVEMINRKGAELAGKTREALPRRRGAVDGL